MLQITPLSGPRPVAGHGHLFMRERLQLLTRLQQECPPMGRFRIFNRVMHTLHTPELIQEVLVEKNKAFEKTPALRKISRYMLGNGLVISEGDFWRRQRKLMAPVFQHGQIEHYARCMADITTEAAHTLAAGAGTTVDMARELTRITMRIVGRTLFDTETNDDVNGFAAALNEAQAWISHQVATFPQLPPWVPLPRNRRFQAAMTTLRAIILKKIGERRATGSDRPDLLTRLLKARDTDGSGMTDEQLLNESLTLFSAGHETTSNSLAFALHLLVTHPAIYDAHLAEVDALPSLDGDVLARLPLTLRIIKETVRLYPSAYVIGRQAETSVEVAGIPFPRGTIFMISPYALHRDARYWPSPETFDPDRFLDGKDEGRPRHAYIPFGGGARVCIGNHFATMEMALVLAALGRKVRFEAPPGRTMEPEALIFLRPRGGLPLTVRARAH